MRIVFTSFAYYPELSGVPIVIKYLAEGLAKLGHVVTVITRMNGLSLDKQEYLNGVEIIRFNIGQTITKKNTGEIDSYINYVIKVPKDVLVLECLQCQTTDILLPYLSRISCKKILHSHGAPGILMKPIAWEGDILHTIGHIHNWIRWKHYYKWTFPKYSKGIDAAVCLSICSSDMDYLSKTVGHVFIAENAAQDPFFNDDSLSEDIVPLLGIKNKSYILNISNYSDRKNQIQLIKSFTEANLSGISLVLIGSKVNQYYFKVKRLVEKISQRREIDIVLLHDIDRRYFPRIIKQAKLFAMTSKWEEYPVSLVETMAVGTPFVSTLVGNAHILPGGVTARNESEISSLIRVLISNEVLLFRLSKSSKEYALKNNKLDVVIDNYERILNTIIES